MSGAEIEKICEGTVKDCPDVKQEMAIKTGIMTTMAENPGKKCQEYTHENSEGWLKSSSRFSDKAEEFECAHKVVIMGDCRMQEWAKTKIEQYRQLQRTYYKR